MSIRPIMFVGNSERGEKKILIKNEAAIPPALKSKTFKVLGSLQEGTWLLQPRHILFIIMHPIEEEVRIKRNAYNYVPESALLAAPHCLF